MELYVAEYAYYVVELWQEFITRLIKLLLNRNLEENVRTRQSLMGHAMQLVLLVIMCIITPLHMQFRREVVHSLNDNVLVKIKQIGLSCYTMVLQVVHTKIISY